MDRGSDAALARGADWDPAAGPGSDVALDSGVEQGPRARSTRYRSSAGSHEVQNGVSHDVQTLVPLRFRRAQLRSQIGELFAIALLDFIEISRGCDGFLF